MVFEMAFRALKLSGAFGPENFPGLSRKGSMGFIRDFLPLFCRHAREISFSDFLTLYFTCRYKTILSFVNGLDDIDTNFPTLLRTLVAFKCYSNYICRANRFISSIFIMFI